MSSTSHQISLKAAEYINQMFSTNNYSFFSRFKPKVGLGALLILMTLSSKHVIAVDVKLFVLNGESQNINRVCTVPVGSGCALYQTVAVELTPSSHIFAGGTATATASVSSEHMFFNSGLLNIEDDFFISDTFRNDSGGMLQNDGSFFATVQVINNGGIVNSGTATLIDGAFNGGGIINHGLLINDGYMSNVGTFTNTNGAVLVNNGLFKSNGYEGSSGIGITNINAGSTVSGTGVYQQLGGALTVDGTLSQSLIELSGGTVGGSGRISGPVEVNRAVTFIKNASDTALSFENGLTNNSELTIKGEINSGISKATTALFVNNDEVDIEATGKLINNSFLINNGTLSGEGSLVNIGLLQNSGEVAVRQLHGEGVYRQTETGKLTVNGEIYQSEIDIQGGSLSGGGIIQSLVSINGDTNIVETGTAIAGLQFNAGLTNEATLTNYDRLTISNETFSNRGTTINHGIITNNATIANTGEFINHEVIVNTGTFLNEEGSFNNNGWFSIAGGGELSNSGGVFINDGVISVNGGALNHTGTLFNNNGQIDNVGSVTLATGSVLNGSGVFNQTLGSLMVNGSLSQREININGGTFGGIGTIESLVTTNGHNVSISGGPLTLAAGLNNTGWLINSAAGLRNQGTITNSGEFIHVKTLENDGAIVNSGDIHLVLGSNLNGAGTYTQTSSGELIIDGTMSQSHIDIQGGVIGGRGKILSKVTVNGNTQIADSPTLLTFEDGLTNNNQLTNNANFANGGTFDNQGVLVNNKIIVNRNTLNNSGTLTNNDKLINFGTVTNTGTVNLVNDSRMYGVGTFVQTDGTLIVNGRMSQSKIDILGGSLGGSGIIESDVSVNGATIGAGNSPGTLIFARDLDVSGSSILDFEIAGLIPDLEYDQLSVFGTASFAADTVFNIDYLGGFMASEGDFFDLVVAGSFGLSDILTFDFNFEDSLLATGLEWTASFFTLDSGNQSLRLSAILTDLGPLTPPLSEVPEPSILVMFSTGLIVLFIRRRRSV